MKCLGFLHLSRSIMHGDLIIEYSNSPDEIWDITYHILPAKRTNNSLQSSTPSRNRELTRTTYTSTELKFEVSVKVVGLYPRPNTSSTEIEHWTFPSPFLGTNLNFTSVDERPFDHQQGSINFYNSILGMKYKPIPETYSSYRCKFNFLFRCHTLRKWLLSSYFVPILLGLPNS